MNRLWVRLTLAFALVILVTGGKYLTNYTDDTELLSISADKTQVDI